MNRLVPLFETLGLSTQKATETAANKKLSAVLETAARFEGILDRATGALLYYLASNVAGRAADKIPYLSLAITEKRLLTSDQVAVYAEVNATIDDGLFDASCGVGVQVSSLEISTKVAELLEQSKLELETRRYQMLGPLLLAMRKDLRWANGLLVKEELDKQMLAALGPKETAADMKKKKEKVVKVAEVVETIEQRAQTTKLFFEGEMARLHKAGGNPQIRPEIMTAHLKRTGGQMITRFPPEPNGFLHIGHAKAININFGLAAANGGLTYLRYDDTNPEAEEDIYFTSILETIKWLGFKPSAIKYSSDYFQQLYELAIELIKKDKAYICHHTADEMRLMRGGDDNKGPRTDSKWRNRPIEESLAEFQKMKDGLYKEGVTTLRMKQDMQSPNPQFWDLVAYRVLFTPHVRTGKDWCIYPTYDYTHCLCDSFEDITHSLCTTEFVMSRESYYWLVDALEVYKPVQWEYGRLKLTNTVLSKRRLAKLVDEKHVKGWDDPRLFTLEALRRRGFTAPAINAFVRELGVTTSVTTIPLDRLEKYVREHLNETALRLMVVLEPLKITLTNLAADYEESITLSNHPTDASLGSRVVPFSRTLFIDASDFKEQDDPNFFRLILGKSVGLLNLTYPITAHDVVKNDEGKVIEILATYDTASTKKCKAYIQWVAESKTKASPVSITVNQYSSLFHHSDPDNKELVPGGWISDVNPDSLEVVTNALCDVGIRTGKVEDKYQFLRVGYFCIDKTSDVAGGAYVFNRTTGLKESGKKD